MLPFQEVITDRDIEPQKKWMKIDGEEPVSPPWGTSKEYAHIYNPEGVALGE